MTEFTVFGPPATKGSTRSFMDKRGVLRTKADCRSLPAWTQAVGWAAREAGIVLIEKPRGVRVVARLEFQRPASVKAREHMSVRPDVEKVGRALLDALIGIAYTDDAQVVSLSMEKVYGSSTLAVIQVEAA